MKLSLTKDEKKFLAGKYQKELELSKKEAHDYANYKSQAIKLINKNSIKINKLKEKYKKTSRL